MQRILNLGVRRGGRQHNATAALPLAKDPLSIVQEAGWASVPVWTGTESFSPSEIQPPDREARSEWLYRLHYADHFRVHLLHMKNCIASQFIL